MKRNLLTWLEYRKLAVHRLNLERHQLRENGDKQCQTSCFFVAQATRRALQKQKWRRLVA